MRRIGRYLRWGFLLLALLVVGALLTLSWWAPPTANAFLPSVLRRTPVEEAEISIQHIGLTQSRIEISHAVVGAVSVEDASVQIGYSVDQLQRKRVDEVTVLHPDVKVDLKELLAQLRQPKDQNAQPFAFPEPLPLFELNLSDARVQLQGSQWQREFTLSGQATSNELTRINLQGEGGGDRLSLRGVGNLATATARFQAALTMEDLAGWLPLAREFKAPLPGWLDSLSVKNVHLRAGAQLRDGILEPTSVEVQIDQSSASYDQLNVKLGKASLKSKDDSGLSASLSDWSIKGKTPVVKLKTVSISGGELQGQLVGPWTQLAHGFNADQYGVQLEHAKAPVSIFTGMGSLTGNIQFSAKVGEGARRSVEASLSAEPGEAAFGGFLLDAKQFQAGVTGSWPDELMASFALEPSTLTWGEGVGKLEGLAGAMERLTLVPFSAPHPQKLTFVRGQQGELIAHEGELTFSYQPGAKPELKLDLQAQALDGRLKVKIQGSPLEPRSLEVRAQFDQVSLESLAALLPKFDGRVTGTVSGNLAFQFEAGKINLLPGYLQLSPNTTGRFQYYKQGWLTQDPKLNPEKYVQGKDLIKLMQDSKAASIITELAMRDLLMTSFRLDVLKSGAKEPVIITIEGGSTVKGVEVPVVLNIPVSGDVKETLNLILKLQSKM